MPADNRMRIPLCGYEACSNRCTVADSCGVGYCDAHAVLGSQPVYRLTPGEEPVALDSWWQASMLGDEDGDERWKGLEYGEWPKGGEVSDG